MQILSSAGHDDSQARRTGSVYYALLAIFAIMPLMVARR
jgi:hypothetical protein